MMHKVLLPIFMILTFNLTAQSFYDLESIQTIEIQFAESNWDQLLDAEKNGDENYILAQSVTINGELLDSVGVKYKGNSTYNANQTKNPFHIELDTYKDQNYQGYTDIKLSNVAKDPSFIREVLSYKVLRQYMDAPQSNYANVYVNGTLIGLYSNSESINKGFLNRKFGSKKNTFIKCNPPAGAGPNSTSLPDLVYKGSDSTSYYAAYELKSDYGWDELIDLCDTLINDVEAIEKILDVDRTLWMLAFNNILVNLDSYIGGFKQNYYLYRDDYNRFIPVVWDLNESFGRFSMTGSGNLNSTTAKAQMDPLLHSNDTAFPLVKQLLSNPQYKRMYIAHCKTMLLENFGNNTYYETGLALQNTIDQAVQADVNKFFTYANFKSNLTSDVNSGGGPMGGATPGITTLMNARNTYLLAQSEFATTDPTIEDVNLVSFTPVVGQPVSIIATIKNANNAYLAYRSTQRAPFTKIAMSDDGLHGDGAASDGVYGVTIDVEGTLVEYYIYAENNEAGLFSPRRAEYEYHKFTATTTANPVGDLVINEFMASNATTEVDQDGEYDDWVELYNNSNTTIDLSGYYLSDDVSELNKWSFPQGTSIAANAYLIIWTDDDEEQEGLHTNFKLSAAAESVVLSDANTTILDEVSYVDQTTDVSYGRYPNGTGDFRTMPSTFNAENMLTSSLDNINIQDIQIAIIPNPATDFFQLSIDNADEKFPVKVYNLAGKLVYQSVIEREAVIATETWAHGIYVVQVGNRYMRVVIQ